MIALSLAITAAAGAYLLYSYVVFPQRGRAPAPQYVSPLSERARRFSELGGAQRQPLAIAMTAALLGGALGGWVLFGGWIAPLLSGVFAAGFPVASFVTRKRREREEAFEAWPRMIDEIRLRCTSIGSSIPQALLDVGKRGPEPLRPVFRMAEREWLMSADFERTIAALKEGLANPTADTICETLLVAHTLGGNEVDRRLAALARDRHADLRLRKDAQARSAGVRFARRFVLLVPLGMALAGLSIGNGRDAYASPGGQLAISFAILVLAGCWWWASLLIRLPQERRVFHE